LSDAESAAYPSIDRSSKEEDDPPSGKVGAMRARRFYGSKGKTRFQSRLTLTITHPLVVA
jgi:hypothetical protein